LENVEKNYLPGDAFFYFIIKIDLGRWMNNWQIKEEEPWLHLEKNIPGMSLNIETSL
jgi:hypothetical protein